MPSEKLRYIDNGPSPLIQMNELKQHLSSFSKEHLIEIVWQSAQSNLELWRALNARIGFQLAKGDWEKAKAAIDYALYFPDVVPYSERGHDIIIYEIIKALDDCYENSDKKLALRAAKYTLKEGREAQVYFDDDWNWSYALEYIEKWINNKTEPVT